MNFKDAQKILTHNECRVTFKSLTSDKTHTDLYTIPREFQSDSDKILVWNIGLERWEDIQVDTILSIDIA